jgi:F-type H+-transporting ATPase subunit epsilon
MKLKVVTPVEMFIVEDVVKISAEGNKGFFCLLPRHVDFVSSLVPGILSYTAETGGEVYIAVDEGLLIKKQDDVTVSVKAAIKGKEPGSLNKIVGEHIESTDEREKKSRQILAKMEADFARRFLEIK